MTFGIGNVIATMFRVWVTRLPILLVFTVLFYIPYFGWLVFASTDWGGEFLNDYYYQPLFKLNPVLISSTASGEWILTAWIGGALAIGTFAVMRGERFGFGKPIKAALRRTLQLVGVALIARLLTVGVWTAFIIYFGQLELWMTIGELGFYLIGLAYLFLVSLFAIVIPIAVTEKRGVFSSLWRNFSLARGQRIRVFGIVLFQSLVHWGLIRLIYELAMPSPYDDLSSYQSSVYLWSYLSLALELVFASLAAVMSAVIYERLREAKEGPTEADLHKVFE